jgi:ABC-2 type transport system permease protein
MTRALTLAARQAWLEQRTFWRSMECALLTFALPLALLLLLGATTAGGYLPGGHIKAVTLFVPSIIAFGVIVAAYVNLGAKITVLRHDGVLKRIRTTPLPSGSYLGGLLASTVTTTVGITLCTALAGWLAFGAAPRLAGLLLLAAGLSLGIVCFAALGVAISSVIRSSEAASPVANASYLPIAIVSGIFDPTMGLPKWLSHAVDVLPVHALAQVLEDAYTTPAAHGFPGWDLLILALWAAGGVAVAVRRFRWQP